LVLVLLLLVVAVVVVVFRSLKYQGTQMNLSPSCLLNWVLLLLVDL